MRDWIEILRFYPEKGNSGLLSQLALLITYFAIFALIVGGNLLKTFRWEWR